MKEDIENHIIEEYSIWTNKSIIIKNLELFDIDIYTNLFYSKNVIDGELFVLNDKVKLVSNNGNFFKYKVIDDQEYNVTLSFNISDINECEDAQCQCDSFIKSGINCKHISAALIFCKAKDNYIKLKSEILKAIKVAISLSEEYKKFVLEYDEQLKNLNSFYLNLSTSKIEENNKSLLKYTQKHFLDNKNYYELINIYNRVLQTFTMVGSELKNIIKSLNILENYKIKEKIFNSLEKLLDIFYLNLLQIDYISSDYSKDNRLLKLTHNNINEKETKKSESKKIISAIRKIMKKMFIYII